MSGRMTVPEALANTERCLLAGQYVESEDLCRRIIAAAPEASEAYRLLSLAHYFQGRLGEAVTAVERSIALGPADITAFDNLALFLTELRRFAEAEQAARQCLARQPNFASAINNLARALLGLGRFAEAEQAARRALALEPEMIQAKVNLRNALAAQGKRTDGVLDVGAENNRGVELMRADRHAEAETVFRIALAEAPHFPELHANLGMSLARLGRKVEAEAAMKDALHLRPGFVEAEMALGELYQRNRRLEEAAEAYRRVLAIRRDPEALNDIASLVYLRRGQLDEAQDALREALELDPSHSRARSNFLMSSQYRPGITRAELARLHGEWERHHGPPPGSIGPHLPRPPLEGRPIRVGLVSADLFSHTVSLLLVPTLEHVDPNEIQWIAYSCADTADAMTQRLAARCHLWRNVRRHKDEELARQIEEDRVDLLLDLAGHTGGNRLTVFARKPAPVQATWIGYVGTTGLSAIDYLIADRFHVPPEHDADYPESVVRLPDGYLCYEPPEHAPPVGPLPAFREGCVTFGNFNGTVKLNPPVARAWAEILRRVPRSRLMFKYHWFDDALTRKLVLDLFAAEGVGADRLILRGSTGHADQLAAYNQVDLALDTFPYSGGITTCEALWMGVPVVTFPGETFAGRHSYSHLSNAGVTETIADSLESYIDMAVRWATDLDALAALRASLRDRMRTSPLCDALRFARHFTAAVRKMVGSNAIA